MISLVNTLPMPSLDARPLGAHRLLMLTDDRLFESCGTRIGFTERDGGVSAGPYASLNLGLHVQDDSECVRENRSRVMEALGAQGLPLVVPNQVHRTTVVSIDSSDPDVVARAQVDADVEADALAIGTSGVAALLNFADCTPVIIVSPSGNFAIAHAGWRGAVGHIAAKAARCLIDRDVREVFPDASFVDVAKECNAYIGPHIQVECFETGEEVSEQFRTEFEGEDELSGICVESGKVVPDPRHVDLSWAVRVDLLRIGFDPARIFDSGICTKCDSDKYFSYRASGGKCGRHGAVGVRFER